MRTLLALAALCAVFIASSAQAQPAPEGAADPDATPKIAKSVHHRRTPKEPSASAVPGVETIVGRDLLQGGANGLIRFSGQADNLQIERFSMIGEVISDPKQQCRIDVKGETAIATKDLGRPDGLQRFEAEIPACPFTFDIVNGGVLVPRQLQACVFTQADCQTNPAGLWGPEGAGLATDAKAKKEGRASAEAAMSRNYQALAARLNDPSKANAFADDQSRFLSDRDEICRAYSHEDNHGFCTIRMTEARAAFLKARIDELPPGPAVKQKARPHRRKSTQED